VYCIVLKQKAILQNSSQPINISSTILHDHKHGEV